MLVSEFIAAAGPVRPVLQDAPGDRWSDDTLRGLLTDGVRELFTKHPETRTRPNYERAPIPETTLAAGDTVPVSAVFLTPLAEWVLFKAFSLDAKDDANVKQAAVHLTAYQQFFQGDER